MTVTEQVAEEIRALMARRRVAQTTIGDALHLSQTAVSRRLNGKTPLDVNELAVIAGILGTQPAKLMPPVIDLRSDDDRGTERYPGGSRTITRLPRPARPAVALASAA